MEYKIPITNKPLRKEQNYYALDDESLSIKIDINTDIQELKAAISYCLAYPIEETSWSNLDDLFQYGLCKYLTKEQSLLIIQAFYQYIQKKTLISNSSLCIIQKCLEKYCQFVPPELVDFLFRYSISKIRCDSKISLIETSLCVIYIIMPFTNEIQRYYFIQYLVSTYPQISLMDSFPHSSFLICISKYFEVCTLTEVFPAFQQLSHIILIFLPYKLWGLPFDAINIIGIAIYKDPKICFFLLQPKFNFFPILTELVLRKKEALSLISINLFISVIELLKIIPESIKEDENTNILFNQKEFLTILGEFAEAAINSLPTPFEDLEISVIRCITLSLQIGLNPLQISKFNLFNLFYKNNDMNYKHKKVILSFAFAALQKAATLFFRPFIELNDGKLIELVFDSVYDEDEEMLFDGLNIILILIRMQKQFLKITDSEINDDTKKIIKYFLSVFNPNCIDIESLKMIQNEEIQNLTSLLEKEINSK